MPAPSVEVARFADYAGAMVYWLQFFVVVFGGAALLGAIFYFLAVGAHTTKRLGPWHRERPDVPRIDWRFALLATMTGAGIIVGIAVALVIIARG